jgi:hypothetical protein
MAWFGVRTGYRLLAGNSTAAYGIGPIVICALALIGRSFAETQRRRAVTAYRRTKGDAEQG